MKEYRQQWAKASETYQAIDERYGNTPPTTGACFTGTNEKLRKIGIDPSDVVVGLDGIRVENREQYFAVRTLSDSPDMLFLVWDGQRYAEMKAQQPGRRFNLDLRSYRK